MLADMELGPFWSNAMMERNESSPIRVIYWIPLNKTTPSQERVSSSCLGCSAFSNLHLGHESSSCDRSSLPLLAYEEKRTKPVDSHAGAFSYRIWILK